MKRNIKEYKELVNVVANIQENLEYNMESYKERKNDLLQKLKNDDCSYYEEEIDRIDLQIKATETIIDNLEKLL